MAGLLSNMTVDGDQRPMKHKSPQKIGLNIEEKGWKNRNKLRYKRATEKLPKDTKNTPISMQNPPAATQQLYYHPHLDINTAHTIWNPVTQAKLDLASLSITSLGAWITGIYFNPNIPNSYFAKAYLPNAILTGYKDSILRTAKGCVFACIHFDHADCQVFDLTALNALEPDSHVTTHNNVQVLTRPSNLPSMFPPPPSFPQAPDSTTMDP